MSVSAPKKFDVTWRVVPETAAHECLEKVSPEIRSKLHEASGTIEGWDLLVEDISAVEKNLSQGTFWRSDCRHAYVPVTEDEEPDDDAIAETIIESLFHRDCRIDISEVEGVEREYVEMARICEHATSASLGFRPFDAATRAFSEIVVGTPLEGCWGVIRDQGTLDVWTENAITALPSVVDEMRKRGFKVRSSNCATVSVDSADGLSEEDAVMKDVSSYFEMVERDRR